MKRRLLPGALLFLLAASLLAWYPWQASAQPPALPQWIWFDEGDPRSSAPAEARYFRHTFSLAGPAEQGVLEITADNHYTAWLNGTRVGAGDQWQSLDRHNVTKALRPGKNVLAVEGRNDSGPAGLVVRLTVTTKAGKQTILSNKAWKSARTAAKDWLKVDFDDSKWKAARELGAYGKVGPWLAGGGGAPRGTPRFTVPEGFQVEPIVKNPGDRGPFSLVNMTFDARGRLLVSQEGGPVLLCTNPDKDGVLQDVKEYCRQVRNCQGMCWIKDALFLVGDGPKGTGLYRCRDTHGDDNVDEVTLLHRFQGGMGEHGPHAVLHGPDGWLYLVIGNHAWASVGPKKAPNPEKLASNSPLLRWPTGGMGPDQGKPGSTEDVLLPRLNDARGHAANILAPGGTIWRLGHDGKDMSLVAAGFRNHFDAAFSPAGELFTFDSDMEWDEGLPWYRAVRICHCPPGADFVWRTGAANTPNYYLDSLPPLYETGRGSPVGLEFYDHHAFPAKYKGAFFMADWSIGVIYAVHLKRAGGTYEADPEKFCVGSPMNVTDLAVAPDGSIWFTTGGRGSQGGVYRIRYTGEVKAEEKRDFPQPNSGWGRAAAQAALRGAEGAKQAEKVLALARDSKASAPDRLRALALLQHHTDRLTGEVILSLAKDPSAEVRAHAVWLLGLSAPKGGKEAILKALKDEDAFVRRRACEALVRAGVEPAVEDIWPLLGEKDHFVRTAARLVLQRIDPAKWVERLAKEDNDRTAWEGIVALCKTQKVGDHARQVFARLARSSPKEANELLEWLRTVQLVCCQVRDLPPGTKEVVARCEKLFPHTDALVNRELAILLTHFRRIKLTEVPVHAQLIEALQASKDRQQQMHYFYCLRFLTEGWTVSQKEGLARWYESTRDWKGGASFTPFLENIFRECLSAYGVADRKALLAAGSKMPQVNLVLAQRLQADRQAELLPALRALSAEVEKDPKLPRGGELRTALAEAVLRTACEHPTADAFPDLLRGLSSANKLIVLDAVTALKKCPTKPKADDPAPYRAALLAAGKLDARNRWQVVELLRHWSGDRRFGSDAGEWKPELASWSRWFGQAFPKEPGLPDAGEEKVESKYKYDDLLSFVQKEGKSGNVAKGRVVFEKAQCVKCHKYGTLGEGVGPDLTTLAKRFKRADVLESIYYPSKVISDQYRSTTIVTLKGQQVTGLAAVQGEMVTVLQSDGSKVTLNRKEIDQQYASLVSVMPERLLDPLSKEEIADLFAFLESEPGK